MLEASSHVLLTNLGWLLIVAGCYGFRVFSHFSLSQHCYCPCAVPAALQLASDILSSCCYSSTVIKRDISINQI